MLHLPRAIRTAVLVPLAIAVVALTGSTPPTPTGPSCRR